MPEMLAQRTLRITEGRDMRPFDAKRCLPEDYEAHSFSMDFINGEQLPTGISIDSHGVLRGVPMLGTCVGSPYQVIVDIDDETLQLPLQIHVGEQMRPDEISYRKGRIWRAFHDGESFPEDIMEMVERPITKLDVYNLVQRYASFTIWNADDLRLAETGRQIKVNGISDKFRIYDFDVCLVGNTKDLFDSTRTLKDALVTARAMVREVHRRRWNVEFSGFDRMALAAWQEVQKLNSKSRHKMQINNYNPPGIEAVAPAAGMDEQPEPE